MLVANNIYDIQLPLYEELKLMGLVTMFSASSVAPSSCWWLPRFHRSSSLTYHNEPSGIAIDAENIRSVQNRTTGLLELPLELRFLIIDAVLGDTISPYASGLAIRRRTSTNPNLDIALVNKQLHCEVMQSLFSRVTFSLVSSHHFATFFFQMKPPQSQLIRRMALDVPASFLAMIFLLQEEVIVRRQGHLFNDIYSAMPKVRDKLLGLGHLCIYVPRWDEFCLDRTITRCQKAFNQVLWEIARPFLARIPSVEFQGSVSESESRLYLQELAELRKKGVQEPLYIAPWPNHFFNPPYVYLMS